jgi:hypothetical protein
MSVNSTRWSAHADAAVALSNALAAAQPVGERHDKPIRVATIAYFDVLATARRYLEPHLNLEPDGVPRTSVRVDYDDLRSDRPLGIVVKCGDNREQGLAPHRRPRRRFNNDRRSAAERSA